MPDTSSVVTKKWYSYVVLLRTENVCKLFFWIASGGYAILVRILYRRRQLASPPSSVYPKHSRKNVDAGTYSRVSINSRLTSPQWEPKTKGDSFDTGCRKIMPAINVRQGRLERCFFDKTISTSQLRVIAVWGTAVSLKWVMSLVYASCFMLFNTVSTFIHLYKRTYCTMCIYLQRTADFTNL